ncbi:hypothetical protein Apa02nite_096480 [Actinoplanes palleronii]|uniref:Tyr recombinase domain-containing protein n=1 Tax=Actinoplanes palleronii TaxID=113570 RepID=A0ABQ4BTP2_9ACTN|nr:hypothetical protein Apa02nite_096480 [Actinoplanes palleronii]
MLATGARIGEILALRWEALGLAAEHATVTICGTIAYVRGKGFFRQERTKSDAGFRKLVPPRFAVAIALARKVSAPTTHTMRSSRPGAASDCLRRTSEGRGVGPAPRPAWSR